MDKVQARTLKPYESQKLHRMKHQSTNLVNSRHARIILLSRGGFKNAQIAERCDCSPAWVRRVLHRFNHGGIESITWYPYYCGRTGPVKFFSDTIEQIYEVALSPPKALIGMSVWSLSKLRAYLQEPGDRRLHLVRVAASVVATTQDPLAAYQDLERIYRSGVLAEISAAAATLRQTAEGRPAYLCR